MERQADTLAPDSVKPSETDIREALDLILASPDFRASKRCQEFLTYVVSQTLAGRGIELKERTLGVEIFGRPPDYDTNEDGIVRIKASEVRRRLNAYYSAAGKDAALRINLPVGSYLPRFTRIPRPELPPLSLTTAEPALTSVGLQPRRIFRVPFWLLSGLSVVIAGLLVLLWTRSSADVVNAFWAPVLRTPGTVLIAAAYVPVYERTGPTAPFTEQNDQYVGGGDLVAAARISALLGSLHRPFVVKVGSIAFEDLRNSPSVLIGYSSDQWSALSSRLRYYVDGEAITDNGKPTGWSALDAKGQQRKGDDYAVISRVLDRQTNAMLVVVTGIRQYGTEAAAEVVTDPKLLAQILKRAPAGWENKNLQIVLHMNVISNYPTSPTAIASYFW